MILHLMLCLAATSYLLANKHLFKVNPIAFIACVVYLIRFLFPSYWICKGLFAFGFSGSFNSNLYGMYIGAALISISCFKISCKMPSRIRFLAGTNKITSYRLIVLIFLALVFLVYLATIDIPLLTIFNDGGLEETRASVVYSNSGILVVLMKHVVFGFWPGVASYFAVSKKSNVVHWVMFFLGLGSVIFVGRKSSLIMIVIYTFFLHNIYSNKKITVKALSVLFLMSIILVIPFYFKYGYNSLSEILSLIAIRAGVLESASSYIQYEMFYKLSPSLSYLNVPFVDLFIDDTIDVRMEAYSAIYTNKTVGNMQGLGLLILYLAIGNYAYVLYAFLLFGFFMLARFLTDSLRQSPKSIGLWILSYSLIDIGFSIVGINTFSFFSTTIFEPRLFIVVVLVHMIFKLRVVKCSST